MSRAPGYARPPGISYFIRLVLSAEKRVDLKSKPGSYCNLGMKYYIVVDSGEYTSLCRHQDSVIFYAFCEYGKFICDAVYKKRKEVRPIYGKIRLFSH